MSVANRLLVWSNRFRQSEWASFAYRRFRDIVSGPGWGAFHHDPLYRRLMLELVNAFPFTSFVETGTYRGYSTEFIARARPELPVFTCEVNETNYCMASRFLARYPNVTALLGNSDEVISKLIDDEKPGSFPLYFLDAHWKEYWPLRAEMRHIGTPGSQSVIVIDDFEVPGQPQFDFDIDGGSHIGAGEKCNLDYIRPALTPGNTYSAIFPKYSKADSYGSPSSAGLLRGHIILFQNDVEACETFLRRPFAQQHYFGYASVRDPNSLLSGADAI